LPSRIGVSCGKTNENYGQLEIIIQFFNGRKQLMGFNTKWYVYPKGIESRENLAPGQCDDGVRMA
jgi:hypothetical protein